jgi:UTP--glucose-1-phosphate uridylyltransferase
MSYIPVRTALIPVAGLGTRFLPATKVSPKEMLPVVDKPLIQYAVDEAREAGIENFIFVTSQGKSVIEDYFDINHSLEHFLDLKGKREDIDKLHNIQLAPGHAVFLRQQHPLGLGHAVWCARHVIGNRPFALILPDDLIMAKEPCLGQMMNAYAHLGGNVVAVMDVARGQVSRYGIVDIAGDNGSCVSIQGVIEKPTPDIAPSCTAIVGRYILQPDIFAILERKQQGIDGEIQLTDSFPFLIQNMPFNGLRFEGQRFDCGTKEGWLEANIAFAYNRPDLTQSLLASIRKHCSL